MNLSFIWEALAVLFVGFCLLRILGKKTAAEMTGLEIITLLAMASMIGHAISGHGLWKTIVTKPSSRLHQRPRFSNTLT